MEQFVLKRQSTFSEPSRFDLASWLNGGKIFAMARRVFFSFHYQRDLWRVNVVRNSGVVEGISAAGFHDQSLWEETYKKGEDAVRRLIDAGLIGTTVTVVLIGAETANRKFVTYEIEKSVARRNGLLGIWINDIKDKYGRVDLRGLVPAALTRTGAPVYTYEYGKLADWVEIAYNKANPYS